jgi:hypothetical protein
MNDYLPHAQLLFPNTSFLKTLLLLPSPLAYIPLVVTTIFVLQETNIGGKRDFNLGDARPQDIN